MSKKDILIMRRQYDKVLPKKEDITIKVIWHLCGGLQVPEPYMFYLVYLISESGEAWAEIGAFNDKGRYILNDRKGCSPLYFTEIPIPMPKI